MIYFMLINAILMLVVSTVETYQDGCTVKDVILSVLLGPFLGFIVFVIMLNDQLDIAGIFDKQLVDNKQLREHKRKQK